MDIEFNKNEDINKQLVYEVNTYLKKIYLGGGEKAIAKHKEKGKMLARERVAYLIDKDKPWLEIGAFVGEGMYCRIWRMSLWRRNLRYRLCIRQAMRGSSQ